MGRGVPCPASIPTPPPKPTPPQLRFPQRTTSTAYMAWMLLKLGVWAVLHDIALHLFHTQAVANGRSYNQYYDGDLIVMAFVVINFVWSKFVLIWRSARLVCLVDGVDCHEDMRKCVDDHYTLGA